MPAAVKSVWTGRDVPCKDVVFDAPPGAVPFRWRRRQVVRQRSAKPPSPVQIRAAPPIFLANHSSRRWALPRFWRLYSVSIAYGLGGREERAEARLCEGAPLG